MAAYGNRRNSRLATPSPQLHQNQLPPLSTPLTGAMASEGSRENQFRRYEDSHRNPQESGSLRNGAIARYDMVAPAAIADPPWPPTPNATFTVALSTAPSVSCPVSKHQYSRLPEGFIRLFRLMPDRDEHSPIHGQLFNYSLSDLGKGTHLYEALSYVWGVSETTQSVFIDKGYLSATTNLHMALKRLRDWSLDRIIWVDAICINHDNKDERGRQIQSMAEIYAKASRVVVWLEEATVGSGQVHEGITTDSGQALEELRVAADPQRTKSSYGKTNPQAIHSLLQRSWFQRIWVR